MDETTVSVSGDWGKNVVYISVLCLFGTSKSGRMLWSYCVLEMCYHQVLHRFSLRPLIAL